MVGYSRALPRLNACLYICASEYLRVYRTVNVLPHKIWGPLKLHAKFAPFIECAYNVNMR